MSMHTYAYDPADENANTQVMETGTTMSEKWLKCQVFKGMFSDELAILYSFGGSKVSVFVQKDLVFVDSDQEGRVRVRVFERGGVSWAILPSAQSAVVPINDADLVPA